jgi:DNA-binding MarR family transcriptional regulator
VTSSSRKVFAPIPARALRDQRLSGLQLRLLGAIALFDRMGRNGQGCWARHELLAEIASCAYTSVSTELRRLHLAGYITNSRHPKDRRRTVYSVVYTDADAHKFRKRNGSANAEQFGKTTGNSSTGFTSFPNENNDRRVAIDREARDSTKVEKYSGKPARASHAVGLQSESKTEKPYNAGATLAIYERSLARGSNEYLTREVADQLAVLAEDYGTGDPVAGRAWRLLNEYEFPL